MTSDAYYNNNFGFTIDSGLNNEILPVSVPFSELADYYNFLGLITVRVIVYLRIYTALNSMTMRSLSSEMFISAGMR